MNDPTEGARREMVAEINSNPTTRKEAEVAYGQVWDTSELSRDFTVISFLAPFVHVTRKQDGVEGTMLFQHRPRYYYRFDPV